MSHQASALGYWVPDGFSTAEAVRLIGERWRIAEEPAETRLRTFFDTFDWSLYLDGGVLELGTGPNAHLLSWGSLASDDGPLLQPVSDEPGFPVDLPAGPVRARILGPCGIRRLLPRMRIETRARMLRLLDDEDKTRVRIALDEHRFEDPETRRTGTLPARLRILPVRGYDSAAEHARSLLADELGMAAVESPLLVEALAAAGRRPADYSSKIDYRLDPNERADSVTKAILLGLLETVERNVSGAKANLDSEFLHDLRVAVRRTRSAIAQIREVFSKSLVGDWKERFAWVQQVTGPVRDLDVYLLDFEDYRASLPEQLRPYLEPMRQFVASHYGEEQSRLAAILGSAAFSDLLREWRAFLESPLPEEPEAADALSPIKDVADARIRRMAKRVRKEGRAIVPDSPPQEMHELRKSCKKLRYLMEFFQSLYPETELKDLIKLMKALLDNLGTFQDLSVQAEHLRELAKRMAQERLADTDTLLAMGALVGDLYARRQRARESFAEVFAGFLSDENRERMRSLFGPGPEGLLEDGAGN